MAQKSHLGKNWAAFSPLVDKILKIECQKNLLGENWAAFPPVFTTKF